MRLLSAHFPYSVFIAPADLEGCGLEIAAWIAGLSHDCCDGACALEDLVAAALVLLPLGDEVGQTLVEEVLVDDNVVGHGGGVWARNAFGADCDCDCNCDGGCGWVEGARGADG